MSDINNREGDIYLILCVRDKNIKNKHKNINIVIWLPLFERKGKQKDPLHRC